jgi:hypothetical protein
MESNDRMIYEELIRKATAGSGSDLISGTIPAFAWWG